MNFDPVDPAHAADLPHDIAEALAWSRSERGRFGSPIVYVPEVTSTNDVAARLAEAGAGEGTTVVAETQIAGRGRHGRTWCSPPGAGLYVSAIVRPDRPTTAGPRSSLLTLMAGVALADAIREATGLVAEIKWPNDLMVAGRKLAGILAEGAAQGTSLEYIVLGFGINLRAAAYPPDIAARATSIEAELGRQIDRGALLARSLVQLSRVRAAMAGNRTSAVIDRWRQLAPSADGSPVEWQTGEGVRRGLTAGVDDGGALLINVAGTIERATAGEITWL
ncbi:MAG: biotin--[acetyl-CoA-carboxylase] ligase [Acidobacteria bacterium]|nr:biotin--[acetyl-CoA-carboxylase] ligase [Acidobacteriota bacterium]